LFSVCLFFCSSESFKKLGLPPEKKTGGKLWAGPPNDNPLRIKVEVEDAGASPSPAPKITGTDVETKDLMSDVASLKAFAEVITVESAAAVVSAAAEESAAAAAAVTMMGMVGG